MPKLFISYRREDSAYPAHSICAGLESQFGKGAVFMDVDTIPFGVDFRKHVSDAVGQCEILLAVIGNRWLDCKQPNGDRRLEDLSDFVRVEIEAALAREIPVIPVLVDLASLPKEAQLPISLKGLAYRNAAQVRPGPDFTRDIDRLVEGVRRLLRPDLKQLEVASAPKDAGLSPGINGQHTTVDPQFTTQKAPSVILSLTQRLATLRRAPFLGISVVCVVVAPVVFLIAHLSNPWQPRIADSNQRGAQAPITPPNAGKELAKESQVRVRVFHFANSSNTAAQAKLGERFASSILDALLLKQIDATRNSKDWRHPVEVSRGVDLEAERFDEELARLAKVSPFVAVHGYIDNRDKSTERFIAHIRIFNCTIGSAKESSPTVTPLLVDEQEFQDTTEGMTTAAQLIVKKIEGVLEKLSSKGPQRSNEPHLGTSAPTK